METQLQSLIDRIKSEGVEEADKQAKDVVGKAEASAERILADAKKQAEQIIADAKTEATRSEDAGKKALEQAGRNLVLGLKQNITDLFDRVLRRQVADALTPELLASMLEKLAENWKPGEGDRKNVDIQLSPADVDSLLKGLVKQVQKKTRDGAVLKPVASVDAGFRIGEKDGNVFYDFTDKGLTEILSQYLSPKLAEILQQAE